MKVAVLRMVIGPTMATALLSVVASWPHWISPVGVKFVLHTFITTRWCSFPSPPWPLSQRNAAAAPEHRCGADAAGVLIGAAQ